MADTNPQTGTTPAFAPDELPSSAVLQLPGHGASSRPGRAFRPGNQAITLRIDGDAGMFSNAAPRHRLGLRDAPTVRTQYG